MASIYLRKDQGEAFVVRVRFLKKGYPSFNLTFDDWEEACNWADKHEADYHKNPGYYFEWRNKVYRSMRLKKQERWQHILRCKSWDHKT